MADPEIRRTLQNLLPGSRYSVRVRSVNEFGLYSGWSEAIEFNAQDPNLGTLPAPPAPTLIPLKGAIAIYMTYYPEYTVREWHLQWSTDNVEWQDWTTTGDPFSLFPSEANIVRFFRFKIVDVYGRESPYSPSNSAAALGDETVYYDIPFTYPGPIDTVASPAYKFRTNAVITSVLITLNAYGTTSTVVQIWKDGLQIGPSITVPAYTYTVSQSFASVPTLTKTFTANSSELSVNVATAGAGAWDIDVQVRATGT